MKTFRKYLPIIAATLVLGGAAVAGNTNFFTSIGDQTFPFSAPLRDGTAGAIDNMIIGATTPRAATFTSVTNTGGGAITADSITGTDSSLGITGQAATSATAAGGAVPIAGGAGGATSGTGGSVSQTGGAGTGVTTTGGAASMAGGAGGAGATTSAGGVGGAASVTGGAGGAKAGTGAAAGGAGGAAAITGGAGGATASSGANNGGAGGTVTITGGVGGAATAGTGNGGAGGSINLVPGAGGATTGGTAGLAGLVQINGNANLTCPSYYFTGTPAATNQVFFIANRPYRVTSISNIFSAAAGGTSTLDVTKDTSTNAPAAGTALGQAAFNLNATANTVQNATLSATLATITMAAGDRLSVKFNHAIQSSAGVVVTACLAPI